MSDNIIECKINDEETIECQVNEEVFHVTIEGGAYSESADVLDLIAHGIKSYASNNWKRITQIEYNPVTGQVRISYDNV